MSERDRTPAEDPDVCIIGSGPAGALLADRLARRGYDVVILEAGKRFDPTSRTERMERALRPSYPETAVWDVDEARDTFESSGPKHYPLNEQRVKGIGGSTLHWGGRVARFPERDFEMETRYGIAADWPIGYSDLKSYYAAAETELGVAGTDDNPFGPPREEPYPMSAFPLSHSDKLFAAACEELDITVHSVPQARNSESYDGRSQCIGFGTCSPVCPSGAKYSADVHVDKAEAEGARVIDRAVVQRLEHDTTGDRVTGATYRTPDGTTHTQTASEFVLAAGGVESPRLLLLSASPQYPDGLANSSGAVGKYFMDHIYIGMSGRIDEPTAQNRIGFGTMESYQFYEPDGPPPGGFKLEFENNAGPDPVQLALKQREPTSGVATAARSVAGIGSEADPIVWGDELRENIEAATGNWFQILAEIEVLPHPENRVTLSSSKTDTFGNPAPDIAWGTVSEYAEGAMTKAFDVMERIVDSMDASVSETHQWISYRGGAHHCGTTRMGTDPSTSVVDENLRTHDLENLYVAGSGPFVTAGASQPTLTIAALSLRLADHLDRSVL